ncbi:MAG: protein kinase family protein [Pseudomonadales bacterium]|nr:protein kinase family protein [Pseudomonadales bacterium]MBL6816324.1 protein kinase family protein [Pseudomonadales bacterium]
MVKISKTAKVHSFDFCPGRRLANKFEVICKLGNGWEGEVYLVKELATDIERAAKFFYPQRNINNKAFKFYANKLHKLRQCSILIQYLSQDTITFSGAPITFLVSDYIEGEILSEFIQRQPGKRLGAFQALHFLYALTKGVENIHQAREYHGDLHTDNIIVSRYGLNFELKLIDMYQWQSAKRENICYDVVSMIQIFHEILGGQKHYAKQPQEIKAIVCGLKSSLILKKFRSAGQLRTYLENLNWN